MSDAHRLSKSTSNTTVVNESTGNSAMAATNDDNQPLKQMHAHSVAERGVYGSELRSFVVNEDVPHPGIRRFLTEMERHAAKSGLFSLTTRHDAHADLVAWHPEPNEKAESVKEKPDPNLIVFDGPNDPINPQVRRHH